MIRRLLLLNGLAVLGVLLFHGTGWGFTALFAWKARYLAVLGSPWDPAGSPTYYFLRVIEQVIDATIPTFVFVSGFFIAIATGRTRNTVSWTMVRSRVLNLLIPYLLWSGALLALKAVETHRILSPVQYARVLLTGDANPAYYYVVLIIQFYLLSPFIVGIARTRWKLLLGLTGVIQVVAQALVYPHLLGLFSPEQRMAIDAVPKWLFLARIFWFCLGVVVGFHIDIFKQWAYRMRWYLVGTWLASFVVGILEWEMYVRTSGVEWLGHRETLVDSVYAASFLFVFIAFEKSVIPLATQLGELGARSFGIYISHSPVMEYTARAVYHLFPRLLPEQAIMLPLVIGAGLVIPLLMMTVVKKTPLRGLYSYVFG